MDERLIYGNLIIFISFIFMGDFVDKIWVLDIFFVNDKNLFFYDVIEKNKMICLYGNGFVVYGMR